MQLAFHGATTMTALPPFPCNKPFPAFTIFLPFP